MFVSGSYCLDIIVKSVYDAWNKFHRICYFILVLFFMFLHVMGKATSAWIFYITSQKHKFMFLLQKEGTYKGKKFNAICHFFGYQARGSLPSKFDCDYAYVC